MCEFREMRARRRIFSLLLLFLFSLAPVSVLGFKLTVLHVNDIHVRLEETNKYTGNCKAKDSGKICNNNKIYLSN